MYFHIYTIIKNTFMLNNKLFLFFFLKNYKIKQINKYNFLVLLLLFEFIKYFLSIQANF